MQQFILMHEDRLFLQDYKLFHVQETWFVHTAIIMTYHIDENVFEYSSPSFEK